MSKSLEDLARDVDNLQKALSAFVIWTAQSAASPISIDEAEKILNLIKPKSPSLAEKDDDYCEQGHLRDKGYPCPECAKS